MKQIMYVTCRLLACAAMAAGLAPYCPAQDDVELSELNQQVTSFFTAVSDKSTARRAVEDLLGSGPLKGHANTPKLIEQAEQLTARFGKYIESEQISARMVGRDLALMTYIYKTDQFPVVWRFAFYRAPTRMGEAPVWRTIAVSFDTNYRLLELSAD